ncbi:unnamed protein product [Cuscuta campestris]|uniref:RING-type domain-containing protein n=1 Tax=Cuscuta campestris TaxID=132261 RepID=A0A484M647_9ASTE|nr:unnamed protein product [Cuscuta campestris]
MPAEKRYSSDYHDGDEDGSLHQTQHRRNQSRRPGKQSVRSGCGGEQGRAAEEVERIQQEAEQLQQEEQSPNRDQESIKQSSGDDSDETGTDPEDFDELISVSRSAIRGNVQCPICLGIIKRTRVVMGCQHRFCKECIDKSMRLGNNECPACRIHCASRRSLRDDPRFDALIKAIFPDVEKYEEEELVFHEEERALNQQIQASIAQVCQRQSEALIKRRKLNKELNTSSTLREYRSYRNAYSRRRRRSMHTTELQQSEHNESEGDPDHKSQTDEHGAPAKARRRALGTPSNHTYPSPSAPIHREGDIYMENSYEKIRRETQDEDSPIRKPETFTWGRGGMRSHVRHGSSSSSKNVRANQLSKITDCLKTAPQINESQQDAHGQLVSCNAEDKPSLEKPSPCCNSSLSINDIPEHEIAGEVKPPAEYIVEIPLEEKCNERGAALNSSNTMSQLQSLQGEETLAEIKSNYFHSNQELTLGYMQKKSNICILD